MNAILKCRIDSANNSQLCSFVIPGATVAYHLFSNWQFWKLSRRHHCSQHKCTGPRHPAPLSRWPRSRCRWSQGPRSSRPAQSPCRCSADGLRPQKMMLERVYMRMHVKVTLPGPCKLESRKMRLIQKHESVVQKHSPIWMADYVTWYEVSWQE